MSFTEKTTWMYLITTVIVGVVYASMVLPQVGDTPIEDIAYGGPMIVAVIVSIVASIIGAIAIAATAPDEADKTDERDKEIQRFGDYVAGNMLGGLVAIVIGLLIVEVDPFWIAQALFAALLLQATVASSVKIYRYRRGF